MTTTIDFLTGLAEASRLLNVITPPDEDSIPILFAWRPALGLEWSTGSRWDSTEGKWVEPSDETKRADALAFLGRWSTRFAKLGAVTKDYGEYDVSVSVTLHNGWTLMARAATEAVCRYEPELDADGNPITEEVEVPVREVVRTDTEQRPKLKRICPPSFLAGAQL